MKPIINITTIIFFTFLMSFCKKDNQISPTSISNLDIEILKDDIIDTILIVKRINVSSTNDSILKFANIKIIDAEKNIYYDDLWTKLKGFNFSLKQRKIDTLQVILYFNNKTIKTKNIIINNTNYHYPDFIKILSITVNKSLSYIDYDHSTTNGNDNIISIQNYSSDYDEHYFYKYYSEDKTVYTLDSCLLPFNHKVFLIKVKYAKTYDNILHIQNYDTYSLYFRTKYIYEANNIKPNIIYHFNNADYDPD